MPAPSTNPDEPRNDSVLNGEVEIWMPPCDKALSHPDGWGDGTIEGSGSKSRRGSGYGYGGEDKDGSERGRKRVKAVRVGIKTVVIMDMGPDRKGEEDVIFERKVEVRGGTSDGLWLEEGMNRFDFSIIIPSTLAPHDWHHNARLNHFLWAELEGLPEPQAVCSSSPFSFSFFRRGSAAPQQNSQHPPTPKSLSPTQSPRSFAMSLTGSNSGSSRSPSPIPGGLSQALNPGLLTSAASMTVTRQEALIPKAPTYDESEAVAKGKSSQSEDDISSWLVGTYKTERRVMLIYNPHPHGGVSELDVRLNGFAEGVGPWDMRMVSDEFTVAAFLPMCITLPSLPPTATIFSFSLLLAQTTTLVSPRDDPNTATPLKSTRHFTIIERGTRPPKDCRFPTKDYKALWRGIGVPGSGARDGDLNGGVWGVHDKGRLPLDEVARPSTLPGIITPIRVSHSLIANVYFSIQDEDEYGRPCRGPGGLRLLKVSHDVILPSCALIGRIINPPTYATVHPSCKSPCLDNSVPTICPTCHCSLDDQICTSCPTAVQTFLHPRHDHPPELVGNTIGVCPECSVRLGGQTECTTCACYYGLGNIEERMKAFTLEERGEEIEIERVGRGKEIGF